MLKSKPACWGIARIIYCVSLHQALGLMKGRAKLKHQVKPAHYEIAGSLGGRIGVARKEQAVIHEEGKIAIDGPAEREVQPVSQKALVQGAFA